MRFTNTGRRRILTIIVAQQRIHTSDVIPVAYGGQCDECEVHALVERPSFEVRYDTGRDKYEDDYARHQVSYNVHNKAQLRAHHPLRFVAVVCSENLNRNVLCE